MVLRRRCSPATTNWTGTLPSRRPARRRAGLGRSPARQADSGFEKVRLGFVGTELKGMELLDNFGQTTHIRFSRSERNPALPPALFKFHSPPPGRTWSGNRGGAPCRSTSFPM